MLDYLRAYGHVSLEDVPMNDVDRLIFAQAAYLNFTQAGEARGLPLSQALQHVIFDQYAQGTEMRFGFQHKDDQALCELLSTASRYACVLYEDFVCAYHHESEVQFAALILRLPADHLLIAYRGTDNTLAGWKEDFNLAWMEEIPAQMMACDLADRLAPLASSLELLGHSKGGNLALYAAVCGSAEVKSKLHLAVSFDGPGLHQHLIDSASFRQVQSRLRLIIPRASLVSLLFRQPENERIVESSVYSILQHYPYTWLTEGMDFRYAATQSRSMQTLGEGIRMTLERLDAPTRERFVEAVYQVLEATGAQTAGDLVRGWAHNTRAILRKMLRTDRETVLVLLRSLGTFWLSVAEAMGVPLLPHEDKE